MWRMLESRSRAVLQDVPALAAGEVHVWHASVCAPSSTMAALHALLAPDERVRAARFHRAVDRDRYAVTRSALRILLSGYARVAAAALTFACTEFGKPQIPAGDPGDGVAFNVSHSGDKAVLAFSRGPAVGIDIEAHRPDVDVLELSRMVFADAERALLAAAAPEYRHALFYRAWARKEAVLKGCGTGLSSEPKRIVVLDGGDTVGGVVAIDAGARFGAWGVCDVDAGDGYSASVAAPGTDWQPRCFDLLWAG